MSGRFPYRAEFSVSGDPKALKTALLSLKPETGITGRHEARRAECRLSAKHSVRTEVDIEMRDNELFLVITAKDSTALRAGINSYLRWLNEALEVYERTRE